MADHSMVLWRPAATRVPARSSTAKITRACGTAVAYARTTTTQTRPHILLAAGCGQALVGLLWRGENGTRFLAIGSYVNTHRTLEGALSMASGSDPRLDGQYPWGGEIFLANLNGRPSVGAITGVNDRCGLLHERGALLPTGPQALADNLRGTGPIKFIAGFAMIAERDAPDVIDGHIETRRLDRHTEIAGGLHVFAMLSCDPDHDLIVNCLQKDAMLAQSFATLAAIFRDALHLLQREVAVLVDSMRRLAQGEEISPAAGAQFASALELVVPRMVQAFKTDHVDVYELPSV